MTRSHALQYLTVMQAAKRLRVSRQRIQQLVQSGILKSRRFGWAHAIEAASVAEEAARRRSQ